MVSIRRSRLLLAVVLALFAAAALGPPAAAAEREVPFFIYDPQGLLDGQTTEALTETYQSRANAYRCGIYVVLFDRFPTGAFETAFDYAQYVYDEVGLGVGEDRDGILLLICTESRDVSIAVHGAWANTAVTDYGREKVLYQSFMGDLRKDQWQTGVTHFLEGCDKLMVRAINGKPVDVTWYQLIGRALLWALLPGMAVGFLGCQGMKGGMKTAREAGQAAAYVAGAAELKVKEDHYVRTSVQHVPRSDGGSGGGGSGGGGSGGGFLGGGTRTNSRGFSGSSRKF